jgi:hypothetical protein
VRREVVTIGDERTAVLVQSKLPGRKPRHPALARLGAAGPADPIVRRNAARGLRGWARRRPPGDRR